MNFCLSRNIRVEEGCSFLYLEKVFLDDKVQNKGRMELEFVYNIYANVYFYENYGNGIETKICFIFSF